MVAYRCMAVLHMVDQNPENYATNTWHCLGTGPTDAQAFADEVQEFYEFVLTYLSPLISETGHEMKIYDLEDPEPRAPIIEYTWDLSSAPTGSPLPTEVSNVLSFQAEKMSGVPQARRRNRVYIGPLDTTAMDSAGRPAAALLVAMAQGAGSILDASALATWDWAIHSSFTPEWGVVVANGWIDNEFDTQRRRGRKATSRTLF